jgi:hypothetical protein
MVGGMPFEKGSSTFAEVVRFDFGKANWRGGLNGVIALLVALSLTAFFGNSGLTAALAALFVVVVDRGGGFERRLLAQVGFAAVGVVVGFVAVAVADSVAAAATVAFVGTLAATLAAAWGRGPATQGVLLVVWLVLALTFGQSVDNAGEIAAAFAAGALIGMAVTAVTGRLEADAGDADGSSDTPRPPSISAALRSPVGGFAVLRAVAVAVTVVLGYWLFPDHRMWATLTAVIIVRPPASQTLVVGIERTVGTVVGVAVGVTVAAILAETHVGLVIAFVISAFLMVALQPVNYALFTTALTALLLIMQAIVAEDVAGTGWDRLGATVVGVVTAFVVIGLVMWWSHAHMEVDP